MGVTAQITGIQKLSELAEKLGSFDREVRIFAEYILNQEGYKNILIAYNIENLEKGIRPDSSEIEKNPVGNQKSTKYERYTEYLKRKRGMTSDVVTLKNTGQFHGSIDVLVGYDSLTFLSRDKKSEILEGIWGKLLGITEEQLFEFTELIRPEFERFCLKHFS